MEKFRINSGHPSAEHFFIESTVFAEEAGKLNMTDFVKEAQEKFDGEYNIEFKVNGHELPFLKVIELLYSQHEKMIEERAAKKALEIIQMSGMQSLAETIERAEWEIRQKFKEVFGSDFLPESEKEYT